MTESAAKCDIEEPELPRKQKALSRFDDGLASHELSGSVEDHFCQIYFETLDNMLQVLTDCFDQTGYSITTIWNSS